MIYNFRFQYVKLSISVLFITGIQLLNGEEKKSLAQKIKKEHNISDYNFLVGGHLYGTPNQSTWPASSLLGNIQNFNQLNPLFFISLGDNVRAANDLNIKNFIQSFVDKLNFPFLTVAGNHDVTDREKFNQYFGNTYYDFSIGSEYFIILDSEYSDLKNQRAQIKYFDDLIIKLSKDSNISNVFILTHKLLWADFLDKYDIVFQNSNNTSSYSDQREFGEGIFKSLDSIKNTKNVFWLSGDVGIWRSFSLFYKQDNKENITFVATGLGDTKDDMILNVSVQEGEVTMKALALNSKKNLAVEKYNLLFWENLFSNQLKPQNILSSLKGSLIKFSSKKTFLYTLLTFLFISLLANVVFFKKIK